MILIEGIQDLIHIHQKEVHIKKLISKEKEMADPVQKKGNLYFKIENC